MPKDNLTSSGTIAAAASLPKAPAKVLLCNSYLLIEIKRVNHCDIAPDLSKTYWDLVNASMAEQENQELYGMTIDKSELQEDFRGRQEASGPQPPDVLLPEMHGVGVANLRNKLLAQCDARHDAKIEEIRNREMARELKLKKEEP